MSTRELVLLADNKAALTLLTFKRLSSCGQESSKLSTRIGCLSPKGVFRLFLQSVFIVQKTKEVVFQIHSHVSPGGFKDEVGCIIPPVWCFLGQMCVSSQLDVSRIRPQEDDQPLPPPAF